MEMVMDGLTKKIGVRRTVEVSMLIENYFMIYTQDR
jgi:hypothetical protein